MEPGPDELKNESARKKTESPLHASVLGHLISLEGPGFGHCADGLPALGALILASVVLTDDFPGDEPGARYVGDEAQRGSDSRRMDDHHNARRRRSRSFNALPNSASTVGHSSPHSLSHHTNSDVNTDPRVQPGRREHATTIGSAAIVGKSGWQ